MAGGDSAGQGVRSDGRTPIMACARAGWPFLRGRRRGVGGEGSAERGRWIHDCHLRGRRRGVGGFWSVATTMLGGDGGFVVKGRASRILALPPYIRNPPDIFLSDLHTQANYYVRACLLGHKHKVARL